MYSKSGFTLIELLVVVLIIGILSAVALPQYQKAVAKARLAEGLSVGKSITNAEYIYKMTNGIYTVDIDLLDVTFPPGGEIIKGEHYTQIDYPNKNIRYVLQETGGWRLDFYYLPHIVVQRIFDWEDDQCVVMYESKLGIYLCQTLGGRGIIPKL